MIMNRNIRRLLALAVAALVSLTAYLFIGRATPTDNPEYGVTFSAPYAEELELDPDTVLTAALDDLGVRRFRIPAYWSRLEKQRDRWDFRELDRHINLIESRGGTIILALGEKAPRWPECWTPDWWKSLSRKEQEARTLLYIETVITRYRDRDAIVAWQIENEPHFAYGDCPRPDIRFFREEVARAETTDPTRPITTTDSGELSLWLTFGKSVDALGISTYRYVRTPSGNIFRYRFVPPFAYARKAVLTAPFRPDDIYVSEFQMEPWNTGDAVKTPVATQMETMDLAQMRSNVDFASKMQISPVDLWGLEWWYWMKETQGHPEFWEMMRDVFNKNSPDD